MVGRQEPGPHPGHAQSPNPSRVSVLVTSWLKDLMSTRHLEPVQVHEALVTINNDFVITRTRLPQPPDIPQMDRAGRGDSPQSDATIEMSAGQVHTGGMGRQLWPGPVSFLL